MIEAILGFIFKSLFEGADTMSVKIKGALHKYSPEEIAAMKTKAATAQSFKDLQLLFCMSESQAITEADRVYVEEDRLTVFGMIENSLTDETALGFGKALGEKKKRDCPHEALAVKAYAESLGLETRLVVMEDIHFSQRGEGDAPLMRLHLGTAIKFQNKWYVADVANNQLVEINKVTLASKNEADAYMKTLFTSECKIVAASEAEFDRTHNQFIDNLDSTGANEIIRLRTTGMRPSHLLRRSLEAKLDHAA